MINRLMTELNNPGLRDGRVTLQQVFSSTICTSTKEPRVSQIWSTMPLKLDFLKRTNKYVPHRFIKYSHKGIKSVIKFERFVDTLVSCEKQVVVMFAPPGMGKTRASEEIHSQLVINMTSHFVVHLKMSHTVSYWNEYDSSTPDTVPSVESFLKLCVNKNKEEALLDKLKEEKVFLILDGVLEIFQDKACKILQDLIAKKVQLLVTSRTQENRKILKVLAKKYKMDKFHLDGFSHQDALMLFQTKLQKPKVDCISIFESFDKCIQELIDTPLYIEIICELYEDEDKKDILLNIFDTFEEIQLKNIKRGLLMFKQMDKTNSVLKKSTKEIERFLIKKASFPAVKKESTVLITKDELSSISISGVASYDKKSKSIHFSPKAFGDFLVAKGFFARDNDLNILEIYVHASPQTRKFIENGMFKNCRRQFNESDKNFLKNNWDSILSVVCTEDLVEFYNSVLAGTSQIAGWIQSSQESAFHKKRDTDGLFVSSCKNTKVAAKLSDICPPLRVNDVHHVVNYIAQENKQTETLKTLLKIIQGWPELWPKDQHIDDFVKQISPLSIAQLDYLMTVCPNLDNQMMEKISVPDIFDQTCRLDLLPMLLKHSLDLTIEQNGVTLANLFFSSNEGREALCLLQHLFAVVKHFETSQDFESDQSVTYRKNVGAKSPKELGLDCSSNTERLHYSEHIVDTVSKLINYVGKCNEGPETLNNFSSEGFKQFTTIPQLLKMSFVLLFLHFSSNVDVEVLKSFQEVEHQLSRNFKYQCGCSLVHLAVARGNLPFLNVLVEKGFSLIEVDQNGRTALHLQEANEQFNASKDGKWNRLVVHQSKSEVFAVFVKSLLVQNFISKYEFKIRSENDQKVIQKILLVQDNFGRTPLHCCQQIENLEVLLRNLFGEFYIGVDGIISVERTLQKQKKIASMLLVEDEAKNTPLHFVDGIECAQLMLQNLLGEYFTNLAGMPKKPISRRSAEELEFTRKIMRNVVARGEVKKLFQINNSSILTQIFNRIRCV